MIFILYLIKYVWPRRIHEWMPHPSKLWLAPVIENAMRGTFAGATNPINHTFITLRSCSCQCSHLCAQVTQPWKNAFLPETKGGCPQLHFDSWSRARFHAELICDPSTRSSPCDIIGPITRGLTTTLLLYLIIEFDPPCKLFFKGGKYVKWDYGWHLKNKIKCFIMTQNIPCFNYYVRPYLCLFSD